MKDALTFDGWNDKEFDLLVEKFEDDDEDDQASGEPAPLMFDKGEFTKLVKYATDF